MKGRKPVSHGVFKDAQEAEHYDRESRMWMRNVVEGFAAAAERWGITGGKVLDIGSGSGLTTIKFAGMMPGLQATGLEPCGPVLEMARRNASDHGVVDRVSFERGDAGNMPFESDTFDMVMCLSTLHLLSDPVKMFDEIQRVLKPGGKFYIRDYRRTWLGLLSGHIMACYTPQEVTVLLERSGLQNWKVKGGIFWLSILSEE